MASLLFFFFSFAVFHRAIARDKADVSFRQNYEASWGENYVKCFDQGKEVQLSMDNISGSGFGSKINYGSGFFHMRIKIPDRNSAGVVTAYYLTSLGHGHDELDFEFLGNKEGKPITLQTNVFANGEGNREQRLPLWFDPTADFHNYRILWNQHQIVFFVDNVPVRVYKNKSDIGSGYPTKPLKIQGSVWNGEDWATDGGRTKIDWSYAPFKAYFQGFDVIGCPVKGLNTQSCSSLRYSWNREKFWQLDPARQKLYEAVKQKHMTYDYCSDRGRYPTPPLECPYN